MRFAVALGLALGLLAGCASTADPPGLPAEVADLPTREVPGLGRLWVAPGAEIAGRPFEIGDWLPPVFGFTQLERGKVLEAKARARELTEWMPGLLRRHLQTHPNFTTTGAVLTLTGRIADSQPGRGFDLLVLGETQAWVDFELFWIDGTSKRTLGVLTVRVPCGLNKKLVSRSAERAAIETWVQNHLAPALAGAAPGGLFRAP